MNGNMTRANNEALTERRHRLFLIGLICLFALSAYALGYAERELDFDEKWTMNVISQPFRDMIQSVASDLVHPPLYFLSLKLWIGLTNFSVFSMRLLSLIFALWALYLTYRLGVELYSEQEGLWAALMLTVSNFHLYYATEIRMYSMVVALSLFSTRSFFRAFVHGGIAHEPGGFATKVWNGVAQAGSVHHFKTISGGEKRHWSGYIIATALLIWTHYLTWLLIASQGAYLLLRAKHGRREFVKSWLRAIGFLVVLTLPWLIFAAPFWIRHHGELPTHVGFVAPHTLSGGFKLIGAFNGMLPIQDSMRYGFFPWSVPILILLWQRRASLARSISTQVADLVEAPSGYLLLTLLLGIVSLTLISWIITPLFVPRYLIYCMPIYYLLVSRCVVVSSSTGRGRLLILLPALLWGITSAISPRLFR